MLHDFLTEEILFSEFWKEFGWVTRPAVSEVSPRNKRLDEKEETERQTKVLKILLITQSSHSFYKDVSQLTDWQANMINGINCY